MQENETKYFDIISDNIKKFRTAKNFSQEVLAEKIDCSREFVNRIENKKETISLRMLLKIASILEINPQKLFEK